MGKTQPGKGCSDYGSARVSALSLVDPAVPCPTNEVETYHPDPNERWIAINCNSEIALIAAVVIIPFYSSPEKKGMAQERSDEPCTEMSVSLSL